MEAGSSFSSNRHDAVHRWVAAAATAPVEGVRGRKGRARGAGGRERSGALWTRSIMHLLAGVVPLSRRAIAPARKTPVVLLHPPPPALQEKEEEEEVGSIGPFVED